MAAMVSYNVTATSGLPDDEQGQATGLTTTTQQIGITVGIPLLAALASTRADVLSGVRLGLAVDAIAVAVLAVTVALGLTAAKRRQEEARPAKRPGGTPTTRLKCRPRCAWS